MNLMTARVLLAGVFTPAILYCLSIEAYGTALFFGLMLWGAVTGDDK